MERGQIDELSDQDKVLSQFRLVVGFRAKAVAPNDEYVVYIYIYIFFKVV